MGLLGAMLKVYTTCDELSQALKFFDEMTKRYHVNPNRQCFGIFCHACERVADGPTAKLLFDRVATGQLPFDANVIDVTQLAVALCRASPAQLSDAQKVLDWSLTRYSRDGEKFCSPSQLTTLYTVIKGCTSCMALAMGRKLHSEVLRWELPMEDMFFSVLIEMYGKCGSLEEARQAFDEALLPREGRRDQQPASMVYDSLWITTQ